MHEQVDFRMLVPRDIQTIKKQWKRVIPSFLLAYETEQYIKGKNDVVHVSKVFRTEEINLGDIDQSYKG